MAADRRTAERNKALTERYPFLLPRNPASGLPAEGYDWSYTLEDSLPDGWKKALCPEIWESLRGILLKADFLADFRLLDLKEKYGALRISYGAVPDSIADEIAAWEDFWEDRSMLRCQRCGRPTKYVAEGWIEYLCADCAEDSDKRRPLAWRDIPLRYGADGRMIRSACEGEMKAQWAESVAGGEA